MSEIVHLDVGSGQQACPRDSASRRTRMKETRHDQRRELGPMLRMAAPLALAELGWMAMGTVDTIMAGPLGAAAIGAGSLGGMLFYPIVISGPACCWGWIRWWRSRWRQQPAGLPPHPGGWLVAGDRAERAPGGGLAA